MNLAFPNSLCVEVWFAASGALGSWRNFQKKGLVKGRLLIEMSLRSLPPSLLTSFPSFLLPSFLITSYHRVDSFSSLLTLGHDSVSAQILKQITSQSWMELSKTVSQIHLDFL